MALISQQLSDYFSLSLKVLKLTKKKIEKKNPIFKLFYTYLAYNNVLHSTRLGRQIKGLETP
jgi:hypothetical protein